MCFFMAGVLVLAAAGDIRRSLAVELLADSASRVTSGGCALGYSIATGSFFLGQQDVFPRFPARLHFLIDPRRSALHLDDLMIWFFRSVSALQQSLQSTATAKPLAVAL